MPSRPALLVALPQPAVSEPLSARLSAVAIMGILNNGMSILGIDTFWQKVVKGLVLLLAVGVRRVLQVQGEVEIMC